jgi:predicted DNA-binding protein (MmcQ/YjbR family)
MTKSKQSDDGRRKSSPQQNWNPYFRALWKHCAAKPEAVEDHPWGETVFKVGGKVFAFLGSPDASRVTVKVAPDQIDGLLALPFIQRSPYIGRYGWLSVTVADDDALALAHELVDGSYETISSKLKGRRKSVPRKTGTRTKRSSRGPSSS